MKLALITDAWHPQINGVVTTLVPCPLVLGLNWAFAPVHKALAAIKNRVTARR